MAETIINLTVNESLRVNLENGNFVEVSGKNMIRVVDVGEGLHSDPPEIRVASRAGGGKISGGIYRPADGKEIEQCLFQFKTDERDRDRPEHERGGEITVHLKRSGPLPPGDDGMVKVIEVRHDTPFNLSGGTSTMRSPNGLYDLQMQDDGNLVVYQTLSGVRRALWSWITGKLKLS